MQVTLVAPGGLVARMDPKAQAFAADWMAKHGVEVVDERIRWVLGGRQRLGHVGAGRLGGSGCLLTTAAAMSSLAPMALRPSPPAPRPQRLGRRRRRPAGGRHPGDRQRALPLG